MPRALPSMRVKGVSWPSTLTPSHITERDLHAPASLDPEDEKGTVLSSLQDGRRQSCLPASLGVGGDLQVTRQKVALVLFLMSKNRSFEASWNF